MTAVGANVEVSAATPSRRSRIALGIAIALASAVFTWYQHGYLIAHAASPKEVPSGVSRYSTRGGTTA